MHFCWIFQIEFIIIKIILEFSWYRLLKIDYPRIMIIMFYFCLSLKDTRYKLQIWYIMYNATIIAEFRDTNGAQDHMGGKSLIIYLVALTDF